MVGKGAMVLLHAYTSLHQGVGQVPAAVDLPIAREKPTGYPVIRHMKGPIRAFCERYSNRKIEDIFGPEEISSESDARAGKVIFSDAYILLFPVRGAKKPFYYVTSPWVLGRFVRHAKMIGCNLQFVEQALGDIDCNLKSEEVGLLSEENVCYEEMLEGMAVELFGKSYVHSLGEWLGCYLGLTMPVVVVSDRVFGYMVRHFTEVVPRIRIDDNKGTVEEGPWWEENVPAESVFYMWLLEREEENSLVEELKRDLNNRFIDVGGHITVGRGKVRVKFIGDGECDAR